MKRMGILLTVMAVVVIAAGMAISASSGAPGTTSTQVVQAPIIETFKLTPTDGQNWRHPAVAEDSKGNRLAIFRGPEGTKYYYVYCPKGGTWSSPQAIAGGNQPSLVRSNFAYMEVDSTDRFHCEWEDAGAAVYASFKDGVWTTPMKVPTVGRYDFTSALALRSDDTVVTADCEVQGLSKDIWLHVKGKNDSQFQSPKNITRDFAGSTQPCIAIDSNDNSWVVWKSDWPLPSDPTGENLVIYLGMFDKNNNDGPIDWQIVSYNPGWAFLPQVAVNTEDKVMTLYAQSTWGQYMTRLFDPATNKLGPIVSLNIGIVWNPWHTFFSRLAAHGKDFYAVGMTPGRALILLKFDETKSAWTQVAQVSDRGVEMFHLYSGYDRMLVAWNSYEEPTGVYLTTVEVDPLIPPTKVLTIQTGPGGTTVPSPGIYTHPTGSIVTVNALPGFPYAFTSWTGNASGSVPTITVTLDDDKTVKANFRYLVQPAVNITVQRKAERSFFNAYYFNILSWEANPLNTAQVVTITAQRIYRKLRTEANTQWARIAEVSPTTMTYLDRNVTKSTDYVYAVSCLDSNGNESLYY